MNNTILNAILTNINTNGMTFVSYTGIGDGSKVFNKGRGAKAMLEVRGHEPTDIVVETTNTVLIGGSYEAMQNNRIKKAVKKLLTEVQLAGGDVLSEGLLEGIINKIDNPETVTDPETGEQVVLKAFSAKSLPWGEWIEGWEGILLKHKGETYVRVYNECNTKTQRKYFLENKDFNIDNPKYADYRKPAKKKSGKVNELNEALSKILDLENDDIKTALEGLKPIKPQAVKISNMKNFTINGQTFN